jgi:hypothetical protein
MGLLGSTPVGYGRHARIFFRHVRGFKGQVTTVDLPTAWLGVQGQVAS